MTGSVYRHIEVVVGQDGRRGGVKEGGFDAVVLREDQVGLGSEGTLIVVVEDEYDERAQAKVPWAQ